MSNPQQAPAPVDVELLAQLADSDMRQGRFESVAQHCERILSVRPGDARAWHRHAIALLELGDPQHALVSLDAALQLAPEAADILQDKALALSRLFRRDEALRCFEASIEHRPAAEQDFHRLSLLVELGRDEYVVELAGKLAIDYPGRADLQITLGWAQMWLGRTEEGLATFEQLVARAPAGEAALWMHAAYANLLAGRFGRGWELHEARTRRPRPLVQGPGLAPEWRGASPLVGQRILVYAEQGIGDSLQFCRYVPMLAAAGARVTLEAPAALHELLGSLQAPLTLAAPGETGSADLQCPILSLPYAFSTHVDTIPAPIPYLRAPAARIAEWRKRLGSASRLRVGLACSGNARHTADRRRSLPLSAIAPWLELDCEFHLLQSELRTADEAFLLESGIHDHRADLIDLSETAALSCCMDLMISVDTSIAHLAGALGRPVWILLSKPSEWRWLLNRDDSPWYPTARLFRMSERGRWDGVIAAVHAALSGICGARS